MQQLVLEENFKPNISFPEGIEVDVDEINSHST